MTACTGCTACAASCPKEAITMQANTEGFLHPYINAAGCNDCGLCCQICPVNNKLIKRTNTGLEKQREPLHVYAAWNLDKTIRSQSSSGGVFTALAENTLYRGGVVVGAAFDNNVIVRHIIIETSAELQRLRASKYVQSKIPLDLYREIRKLLKQERPVLFSGTPCQVAGVQSFLGKSYSKLYCCDVVCHGVPSPSFFARYVQHNLERGVDLTNVSFRDKTTGWKKSCVCHHLKNGKKILIDPRDDLYMEAFARDYTLRQSCYSCGFTSTHRFGDLTLGDFWGVGKKYPEYDHDDKGTSLVLVNTKKGQTWIEACSSNLFCGAADLDTAIDGNPMLARPSNCPPQRSRFFKDFDELNFTAFIKKYRLCRSMFFLRFLSVVYRRTMAIFKKVTKPRWKGRTSI